MSHRTPIERLQGWFLSACDGKWEHDKGISIQTLDNPGWSLTIDLGATALSAATMKAYSHNHGEEDWVYCRVELDQFIAAGDPSKLEWMIDFFCNWATAIKD